MNKQELMQHEQQVVSSAIINALSGLKPDPDLANRIIQCDQKLKSTGKESSDERKKFLRNARTIK